MTFRPRDFVNHGIAAANYLGGSLCEFRRFQEVLRGEIFSGPNQRPEQFHAPSQRKSWEVNLEKFGIAGSIGWTMKQRVRVVEDVFWRESQGQAMIAELRNA